MNKYVETICKALGDKCDPNDDEQSDSCCYLRLFYLVAELIAIVAIVSNAIHQWQILKGYNMYSYISEGLFRSIEEKIKDYHAGPFKDIKIDG